MEDLNSLAFWIKTVSYTHLDVYKRQGRFWWNALHGDLGVSHIYKVNASVTGILAKRLPISIQMGVFAMLLSLVIGIPMGLLMGRFSSMANKMCIRDRFRVAPIMSAA